MTSNGPTRGPRRSLASWQRYARPLTLPLLLVLALTLARPLPSTSARTEPTSTPSLSLSLIASSRCSEPGYPTTTTSTTDTTSSTTSTTEPATCLQQIAKDTGSTRVEVLVGLCLLVLLVSALLVVQLVKG